MDRTILELERDAQNARDTAEKAQRRLDETRRNCRHIWDQPNGRYAPLVRRGYQMSGDPPGTMGVDWRGPCWVPEQVTPQWTRTCEICGKQEHTQHSREVVTKVPVF